MSAKSYSLGPPIFCGPVSRSTRCSSLDLHRSSGDDGAMAQSEVRRAGFRLYWKHKSRGKAGRPRVPGEVRALIRKIGITNPIWVAPRIHGELLKIGIDVSQSTVAKYMVRGRRPPSQGWLTFLRNHAEGIAAIDLFVVPTIGFRLLFGLVILNHDRRKIVHVAATYHPTSECIARQIVEAFPWETAPRYLLRDRDGAYGKVFRKRLSAMGIRDRPVAPRSPWQNAYVERVIGSIRLGPAGSCDRDGRGSFAPVASRLLRLLQHLSDPSRVRQRHELWAGLSNIVAGSHRCPNSAGSIMPMSGSD